MKKKIKEKISKKRKLFKYRKSKIYKLNLKKNFKNSRYNKSIKKQTFKFLKSKGGANIPTFNLLIK